MEFCFIISNARLDYFNIERVINTIPRPIKFILIHSNKTAQRISEKFINQMEAVYAVDSMDFETCKNIIENYFFTHATLTIVCTDEPYLCLGASLREYFNMQGTKPYQLIPFNSKVTMKQIVSSKGIRIPRYMNLDIPLGKNNLKDYHKFIVHIFNGPYIVKPIDRGGCELTAKIVHAEDLIEWVGTNFNPQFQYTAEETIEGELYHCDSFIADSKIVFSDTCKYIFPCLDFLSGKILGSCLIEKNSPLYEEIRGFNEKVVDAFRPPDGALHLEFFVTSSNELVFIEIGARPPGKAVCLTYENTYGVNLYELTLRHALGLPLNIQTKNTPYHGWLALSTFPGTIKKLNIPRLKSKTDWQWKVKVGDVISTYPSSLNEGISAESLIYNSNYEELQNDILILKEHRAYEC